MEDRTPSDHADLLCHRCGAVLRPGSGAWYVVRIEAFADPTPAPITADDLAIDAAGEIEALIAQAGELSGPEMMDQVYRRLVVHLCWPCYKRWIEDPVGG